jgi:DNA-binding NarL/FixJ family response regulator
MGSTESRAENTATTPIRVAVMDDYAVIVSGVQQMLAPYGDRVSVVELVSMLPVESDIDVLLYDTYSRERVTGPVEQVIDETDAKVVLYTWNIDRELVAEAVAKGAVGWLSKSLPPDELVEALEQVHAGNVMVSEDPGPRAPITPKAWPGKDHGLSPRESEILALIAQGLSNQQVADRAFLSINSVKTFIRSAYRKIGVQSRTQAVLWATRHGFVPYPRRVMLPDPGYPGS